MPAPSRRARVTTLQGTTAQSKRGGAFLLTQLVGGGDYVSGDTRVQISVQDAEWVQLGHMVPSDLQG